MVVSLSGVATTTGHQRNLPPRISVKYGNVCEDLTQSDTSMRKPISICIKPASSSYGDSRKLEPASREHEWEHIGRFDATSSRPDLTRDLRDAKPTVPQIVLRAFYVLWCVNC